MAARAAHGNEVEIRPGAWCCRAKVMARPNRFFIWEAREAAPTAFDPFELAQGSKSGNLAYYYNLALELESALKDQGLTFLLTWHLDAFDEGLRDSIVLLLGEDKYQTPSYSGAAKAIFKTLGIERNPWGSVVHMSPAVAWRVALRDVRNSVLKARRSGLKGHGSKVPMFELPIGYYGLREVTWIPFRERPTDVFFAGAIKSTRGFTVRPKLAARRQMLVSLTSAREELPDLRVDCTTSGPFGNPEHMLDPEAYSRQLMSARIVLCPRGDVDETFRVAEAAKSGSVAIVERLPKRWYNYDSPAVQIDRWASLPTVLRALLSDSESLARRSEQMYRWWTERLSEQAAARFIVEAMSNCGITS